jgi:hypothetical protein
MQYWYNKALLLLLSSPVTAVAGKQPFLVTTASPAHQVTACRIWQAQYSSEGLMRSERVSTVAASRSGGIPRCLTHLIPGILRQSCRLDKGAS